jgi:hypothetical protein
MFLSGLFFPQGDALPLPDEVVRGLRDSWLVVVI